MKPLNTTHELLQAATELLAAHEMHGHAAFLEECQAEIPDKPLADEPAPQQVKAADRIRVSAPDNTAVAASFERALAHAINCHSMENGSNTPDYILAKFLAMALELFDATVLERAMWYGRMDDPRSISKHTPEPFTVEYVGPVQKK